MMLEVGHVTYLPDEPPCSFFTGTYVGSFVKKNGVNHLKVGKRFSMIFHELGMINDP